MSIELFEEFLVKYNLDIKPIKAKEPTLTAKEAADVHGVPVSNIVKSLLVKADSEFFLCLCPGDKRLDFQYLREKLGKKELRMANADEVKEVTGHSIGGVPPFGHKRSLKTIIIDGFNANEPLWAAAGASDVNFQTTLFSLKRILKLASLTP